MKIEKPWQFKDDQTVTRLGKVYNVHAACLLAEDLPVKQLSLEDLSIHYYAPCTDTFRSFVEHIKLVNDADLSYPILLNQDGAIIDGMHRLAKAILTGKKTIKARRFIKDPPSCWKME